MVPNGEDRGKKNTPEPRFEGLGGGLGITLRVCGSNALQKRFAMVLPAFVG
jgi:hypothetical protein